MLGLVIYSIVENVKAGEAVGVIVQLMVCFLFIIVTATIYILSATDKWGELVSIAVKHNMNHKASHRQNQIIEATNPENALRVYDDYFTITKNGTEKAYVIENLKNVEIVNEGKGFILKFEFNSGLKRVFDTPIPLDRREEISKIFNKEKLIEKGNKNTYIKDEITNKRSFFDAIGAIIAFSVGIFGVVLTVLNYLGYINLPLFFSMFIMIVGFSWTLIDFSYHRNVNKGYSTIVAGIMFIGITLSALFLCFYTVGANNVLLTLRKMPISICLTSFLSFGINFLIIGVISYLPKTKNKKLLL